MNPRGTPRKTIQAFERSPQVSRMALMLSMYIRAALIANSSEPNSAYVNRLHEPLPPSPLWAYTCARLFSLPALHPTPLTKKYQNKK